MDDQEKTHDELLRVLELYDRDRQLLAYEIHDGVAQQLTGAMLSFQRFNELRRADPAEAQKAFDRGLKLLEDGIKEVRRLIGGLRPPILDESGIVAAIEYLVFESQQHGGPEIRFVPDVQFERLAAPLENAIYRIVQESLTNARRHSKSSRVEIRLRQDDRTIRVEIQDWGGGFDPRAVPKNRFGLRGIRERARLLGGQATIESSPGQGALILVTLPMIEPVKEESDLASE